MNSSIDTELAAANSKPQPSFSNRVADYQARSESVLSAHLNQLRNNPAVPGSLLEPMRYASLGGGKRMRPLLAYATAETLGSKAEVVDTAAAAVELIHAYSLVHDDLPAMDDDDLRRGKATTHIAFDEASAILAGDALQTLAFEIIAEDNVHGVSAKNRLAMVRELAQAAGAAGMCGGQSLDLSFEGRSPTQTELEQMFRGKTGRMITAPVVMAALASDCSAAEQAALREFSDCAGLAFQIHDDVLDIEAETATLGRPQGSDAAQNKATWPGLFGLEAAKSRSQALYQQALAALAPFGERAEPLRWLAAYIIERKY